MNLYDGVVGVNDETKFGLDDIGRFGGSLVQGIATAPILAGKSLTEAVRGRGTKADTGLEGELTGAERAGRTISGLLDAVTPFMAGSGQLVQSLATKVMANAATAAERRLLNRMLTAAAEESVLSGSQAGAEYFGQGGVLVDENGEIDVDKLAQFGKEVGMGAGMGAVGGAALSGAATGINRLGNRGDKLTPEPRPQPTDGNVTFQPANASGSREMNLPQQTHATPYAPPRSPAQPAGPTIPDRPFTPEPRQMTPEPQTPKTPEQTAIDEVRQREQAQREQVQREQPIEQTPVLDESIQPIPEVADGVVNPQPVLPDMPEVRSEQVRALQESRIGKTQAEEAQINQQLQEARDNTPAYMRRTPKTASAAEAQRRLLGEAQADVLPDSSFDADARARNGLGAELADTDIDTIPAYMRKRAGERIPELESTLKEQNSILAALQSDKTSVTRFNDKQMIARAESIAQRRFSERKAQLEPINGLFSKEQYGAILGNERKEAYDIVDRVKSHIADRNATTAASSEKRLKDNLIRRNQTANELRTYQTAKQQQAKNEAERQANNTIDYTDENIPAFARKRAKAAGVPQSAAPARESIPWSASSWCLASSHYRD